MDISFSVILTLAIVLFDISVRVLAVIFIPQNRKPSTATAWLLALFFIPFIGVILFALFGNNRLSKKRRQKQIYINDLIKDRTKGAYSIGEENKIPFWFEPLAKLNSNLGALPLVGGNNAKLYGDYQESIDAMTKRIDKAKVFVHIEFYILNLDKTTKGLFNSLANAQKRGVKVRLLVDHIGSFRNPQYKETLKFLSNNGIEWNLMLPVQPLKGKYQRPDLRNHRKILVIDGQHGFTGSQNIIDRSYNKPKNIKRGLKWQELVIAVEGPVVTELNALFIADWYAETNELLVDSVQPVGEKYVDKGDLDCQVIQSGPGFESENNLKLFNSLMYNAHNKIIVSSPYFVPEESMLSAITTAAQRGVEVELFVSEIGDQALVYHAQRSYYETLLKSGVKIFMYKSPFVLHAKHFTIDNEVTVIGSSNMDIRSFSLNLEVSMMIYSKPFVKKMREVEADYRANSKQLKLVNWQKRPFAQKVIDNLARLTSALQ